ncbi:MAG: GGDEF domain-containing protein, partial [Deltaproteobacteria bacterium]|nr:GGDEF domain-containing protein [Deltaproteobacteria bacterium]
RYDLSPGELSIGRDEAAGVVIDSDLVSRKHASIQRFGGQFVIADLGSTNGTYVNDARIRTKELAEGDQIRVGRVVLKYTECAIEAEYHEQVINMAKTDALTGAFNKRHFEAEFARLVAGSAPLAIVIFDIDHFKKINDTYGHASGDVVLKRVAEVVRAQLRAGDLFFRVGGEEFVLLLPGTTESMAQLAAEVLRGAIEMTDFEDGGKRIPVTVSLGVSDREPGDDAATLYRRTDERLYEAKRGGRNRVV